MDDSTGKHAGRSRAFGLCAGVLALLIALVLQFSAAGKLLGADPKLVLFEEGHRLFESGLLRDHAIAGFELILVILLAFAFRSRFIWPLVAIFFAGLLGYSGYALVSGRECGCFGALWTPPKGVTVGINSVFILGALGLLLGARMKKTALVTAVLCIGAVAAGYFQARTDLPPLDEVTPPIPTSPNGGRGTGTGSPESHTGGSEPAAVGNVGSGGTPGSILDVPEINAHLNDEPGTHLVYVFVHEYGCSTCEMFKPAVEQDQYEMPQMELPITIVMLEMNELQDELGIPAYSWAKTPTVFAMDAGEIVYYDHDEDILVPSTLFDLWSTQQDLGGKDPNEVWGG